MHYSKEHAFTFKMMLVFSRCTVSFNNYSTLYITHSIPMACVMLQNYTNILNLNLSSQASLKSQNKTALYLYFLLLLLSIQK